MKKTLCVILAVFLMLTPLVSFANPTASLTVDGKLLQSDVPPVIVEGRVMVPFRAIFEVLGIEVNWSDALRKAYAVTDGISVILTVDSDIMIVNGTIINLDVAPFISNSRVLVPARALCEALECTVSWDDSKKTAVIKTKNYVEPEIPEPSDEPHQTQKPAETQPDAQPEYNETIGGDPAYIKKDLKFAENVFEIINNERQAYGMSPLIIDERLSAVASYHCQDMAQRDYIDHTSPDGIGPFDRIDDAGISYVSAAENIASGFATPEKVVQSWLNSPKHCDNLLNSEFNKIGVGYYAGGSNGTYWTVVLISD